MFSFTRWQHSASWRPPFQSSHYRLWEVGFDGRQLITIPPYRQRATSVEEKVPMDRTRATCQQRQTVCKYGHVLHGLCHFSHYEETPHFCFEKRSSCHILGGACETCKPSVCQRNFETLGLCVKYPLLCVLLIVLHPIWVAWHFTSFSLQISGYFIGDRPIA